MTSLCPGPLFGTPGLNHYSTPSSRTDTPTDIENRFSRVPFNGIPWPKPSPVSKVYDVRNSSTRMILLNNRYSKKSGQTQGKGVPMKGCRLRGQTLNDGEVKSPDPERHSAETPYVNRKSHIDCGDSSSPVFKPAVKTNLKWANATQRPPLKFEDGSSVNYKRHTTCMVSDDLRLMNWHRPRRPYSTSIIRESMRSRSPLLDDLNPGERLYMYSIAKVYSVDSMRKLKQSQYCHLLHREIERGVYSPEECERYWRYLSNPRKTQQGPDDSFQRKRISSAPSQRDKDMDKSRDSSGRQSQASRPVTSRSKSRSSQRPISRASAASSKSHKKKSQEKTTPTTKSQEKTTLNTKSETSSSRRQNDESTKQMATRQIEEVHDDEGSQNESQVRGEDKVMDKSDEEEAPRKGTKHREGGDRPKSRLGGRNLREKKRNTDNSDDDYSSDISSSSSDESDTENTTSRSKSTSEPTRSSRSAPSQAQTEVKKSTKPGESAAADHIDKHDSSYTEDFTETSASETVSHAKGANSDEAKNPSDNSASDTAQSETVTQSKTTSSEAATSKSVEKSGRNSDTSSSEPTTSKQTTTYETTEPSSSLKPPAQNHKSKSDTDENTDTSTSEDVLKSTSSPATKVTSEEVKASSSEVKASDESYSDDFTESKSQENDKDGEKPIKRNPGENDEGKDHGQQERDSKDVSEGEGKSNREQRRDSIEMDREERERDWDKIEY